MKKGIKQSDIFVGDYFKQKRTEHRYTQIQVCELLGLSQSTFCCYETGSRSMPVSIMKKLCILYHLDFHETFIYLDEELEKKGLTIFE